MTESVTTSQIDDDGERTTENVEEREEPPKGVSRKEKRKALKKERRKQIRKELAEKARAEEESRLNDPEEQRKIQMEDEREKERLERERKEFEEKERIFLEELERKKKYEEEEEQKHAVERELKFKQVGVEEGSNEDDEWEYVEEGPPEIIWQGNEIIVKKNKVRVKKKDTNEDIEKEDANRPTSNPLPPQSEAYASYKDEPVTSTQLLDTVAKQVPNFGTEQDKAHCPFHIKTGVCRFGLRCNRVHYYPDKSSTLLIKNMYNGPGLAWEQDEGLEYTDEEVERSYEEFYEDVHTEFLKFGEIINFKVCRNGSFHLRGNVYVHYKSLDSAVMAYNSVQGRYFAGKQVKCEFVSITRWKVAICGEYMKSRLKTCSRGSACNFLHCFSNPGGDYEWADSDKPAPRYWVKKMTALFGYSDDSFYDKQQSPNDQHNSSRIFTSDRDSYHYRKHQAVTGRSKYEENDVGKSRCRDKHYGEETEYNKNHDHGSIAEGTDSDGDLLDQRHGNGSRHSKKVCKSRDHSYYYDGRNRRRSDGSSSCDEEERRRYRNKRSRHRKVSESSNDDRESDGAAKQEQQIETLSSEAELKRRKEEKNNSARHHETKRRRHHESEKEAFAKKQRRYDRQSRNERRRSRDSGYLSDKNEDVIDRWEPDACPDTSVSDYDDDIIISTTGKPKDADRLEQDLKTSKQTSQRGDRTRKRI